MREVEINIDTKEVVVINPRITHIEIKVDKSVKSHIEQYKDRNGARSVESLGVECEHGGVVPAHEERAVGGGGERVQPAHVERGRHDAAPPRHGQRHAHQARARRLRRDQLAQPQVAPRAVLRCQQVRLRYARVVIVGTLEGRDQFVEVRQRGVLGPPRYVRYHLQCGVVYPEL